MRVVQKQPVDLELCGTKLMFSKFIVRCRPQVECTVQVAPGLAVRPSFLVLGSDFSTGRLEAGRAVKTHPEVPGAAQVPPPGAPLRARAPQASPLARAPAAPPPLSPCTSSRLGMLFNPHLAYTGSTQAGQADGEARGGGWRG